MTKIATIISFCSNDYRFLDKCIQSVVSFSEQIIIPICDHFYNGEPENYSLLQKIYASYPEIEFIEFAYSTDQMYGTGARLIPQSPQWGHHWHNASRLTGSYFLNKDITWVLFVDADEIFEKDLRQLPFDEYDALRLSTYWYFQTGKKQATVHPDSTLVIRKSKLKFTSPINEHERLGLFFAVEGKKLRGFPLNDPPIVHHYSWVRSKEELLKKTKTWGHHWERDWHKLIDEMKDIDFVRGYKYKTVNPFWEPLELNLSIPPSTLSLAEHRKTTFPNVVRIAPEAIARKELKNMIENI